MRGVPPRAGEKAAYSAGEGVRARKFEHFEARGREKEKKV